MMVLMPPRWSFDLTFGLIDKVAALFGAESPLHWLTLGRTSSPVSLYEVDGRTYVMDVIVPKGRWQGPDGRHGWGLGTSWATEVRAIGRGTLTTGGVSTEVILTEATDPAVKHQVVIAYAADKPKVLIATGEHRHRQPTSFLVDLGLARDDTPEGLAAAVEHVAVFEVTPA